MIAAVTGATGFIGRALALRLAASGTRVLALVRDTARAGDLAGTPGDRAGARRPAGPGAAARSRRPVRHRLPSRRSDQRPQPRRIHGGQRRGHGRSRGGGGALPGTPETGPGQQPLRGRAAHGGAAGARGRPARAGERLRGEQAARRGVAAPGGCGAPLDHRAPPLGLRPGRPGDPARFSGWRRAASSRACAGGACRFRWCTCTIWSRPWCLPAIRRPRTGGSTTPPTGRCTPSRSSARRCLRHAAAGRALHVPGFVFRFMGLAGEAAAWLTRRPPLLGRDKACEGLQPGWVCDDARIRAELGYRSRVGLEAGVAETLAWYRTQGWL